MDASAAQIHGLSFLHPAAYFPSFHSSACDDFTIQTNEQTFGSGITGSLHINGFC
jgi:hypothetical protein